MGVNNGWSIFRPNLWVCVDPPGVFLDEGWKDPYIYKFILQGRLSDHIYEKQADGEFKDSGLMASDMNCVIGYPGNTNFDPQVFLAESSVNYGMNGKKTDILGNTGSRSVLLAAIKMAYYLGFRRIYIIGADFHMTPKKPYAFAQSKDAKACKANNETYRILNSRLSALRPYLEEAGLTVYNCSGKDSRLDAFDRMSLEEAVALEAAEFKAPLDASTEGWYRKVDAKPAINHGRKRTVIRVATNRPGSKGKLR
jgi:hypothetical protein